MAAYREITKEDPYGGGDFLRTFYFHGQAFQGMEAAVQATYQVVRNLHKAIAADEDTLVPFRSEEHTSELQSLMRISYAVFCLKKKKNNKQKYNSNNQVNDKNT